MEQDVRELIALNQRYRVVLRMVQIGSCDCCTKSSVASDHDEKCTFRIIQEALDASSSLTLYKLQKDFIKKALDHVSKLPFDKVQSIGDVYRELNAFNDVKLSK